ncbi:MAG TPA: hypothetical protein VJV23_01980 [Candidatus Polarisedimenticolia bacterium]|nr:hypothetical protein [Candidatus Polarisedimenticolia bacterium]
MSGRWELDARDPFGTRPDEKPPAGWDARFWEQVRTRIEQRRHDLDEEAPPPPPSPDKGSPARRTALACLAGAAVTLAGLALLGRALPASPQPPAASPDERTFVRVSGGDPDVAVEWARLGGRAAGYVVLQSLDPEISYVLIDQRPAAR